MGTEVQSKMYQPGYYSVQKLSSNVGHGSWSLLHENKNLKNGQQYELFLIPQLSVWEPRKIISSSRSCPPSKTMQKLMLCDSSSLQFPHSDNVYLPTRITAPVAVLRPSDVPSFLNSVP
ncbi:hypothetical protein GBA52_025777 [Prunus armeniaca]|nr:hypothetical protein GBA52_025777 [Prunus armeniaca]